MIAESAYEWAEYGLEVFRVAIWPLVVIVAVVAFRSEISAALRRITKVSGLGFSAELAREVREIAEQFERVETPDAEVGAEDLPIGDVTIVDPSMAFLRSWIDLERATADWSAALDRRRETPAQFARFLAKSGALNDALVEPIQSLQRVRNEIVHSGAPLDDANARSLIASTQTAGNAIALAAESLAARRIGS